MYTTAALVAAVWNVAILGNGRLVLSENADMMPHPAARPMGSRHLGGANWEGRAPPYLPERDGHNKEASLY